MTNDGREGGMLRERKVEGRIEKRRREMRKEERGRDRKKEKGRWMGEEVNDREKEQGEKRRQIGRGRR